MKKFFRISQRGNLIIAAAFLMIIIAFVTIAITRISSTDAYSTLNQFRQLSSFYIAQAGLERGRYALFAPTISARTGCSALSGTSSLQNVTFDTGVFSISGTAYAPSATTLSTAITNSSSVIPVASLTGFSSQGRVLIEKEAIDYLGTSNSAATCGTAPCLTNIQRGAGGTTAMSHSSGAQVGQYQCTLVVQGGVPVLTPSSSVNAKSVLQENEALTYGLMVGQANGGARLYAWNPSSSSNTWVQFSTSGVPNVDYYAITSTNYNRAWAAGGSGRILYYNGSSWSSQLNVSETFYGIDCVSDQDCWAAATSGKIYHYNGASWSLFTQVNSSVTLNGISCTVDNSISAPPNPPYRCIAIGSPDSSHGMIYDYTSARGTWILAASTAYELDAISCSAANSCWAVGGVNKATSNLIYFNGSTWVDGSIPTVDAEMDAIHCLSQNYCWAGGRKDYVYFYNGSTWTSATGIGSNNGVSNVLYAIRCINTKDCWAGGTGGQLFHYDGTSWTLYATLGNFDIRGISYPMQATNANAFWTRS